MWYASCMGEEADNVAVDLYCYSGYRGFDWLVY